MTDEYKSDNYDPSVEEALIAETIRQELYEGLMNCFQDKSAKMNDEITIAAINEYVLKYLKQLDIPKPEISVVITHQNEIDITVRYRFES
jgi:hypothetical protein